MKKIMLLLVILVCTVNTQAQSAMIIQTDVVQRGVLIDNKWVWGKESKQDIAVTIDGINIVFENKAHTRLTLLSAAFKTENDKMVVSKYYAKESDGTYCTFKIVKWKDDEQFQFYLIYDKVTYTFTAKRDQG